MNPVGARHEGLTPLGLAFAVLLLLMLGVVLAGVALPREIDHDEHQFVASGALLAHDGLLPYRDYPYFHLPNLVYLYALLDRFAASPLLAARLASLAFAMLSLGLVVWLVWSELEGVRHPIRLSMAASAVLLMAFSPLTLYTVGRAWNHDAAVALFLLALALSRAAGRRSPRWPLLGAGLAAGLAVGTRLSFGPAAVGLGLVILLWSRREGFGRGARAVAQYGLGGLLGLGPTLALAVAAPRAFVFGNFEYAALNTAYRHAIGFATAMDLPGKVRFLFEEVLLDPRGILLFGSLVLFLAVDALQIFLSHGEGRRVPLAIGVLLPFLMWGALAPTPSWYQYFYMVVPFAAVATVLSAARADLGERRWPLGAAWVILAALGVTWLSHAELTSVRSLSRPEAWPLTAARTVGARIAEEAGGGPVLTLSPIYALEGGLPIYEQFASGPFAWRVSSFVPPGIHEALHIVSPENLEDVLTAKPPAGILVGMEAELEGEFVAYAEAHGYHSSEVGEGLTLWVR
jgi:4-amino-4-deoxy-L-arabinose transferase-like glycosyltransferase